MAPFFAGKMTPPHIGNQRSICTELRSAKGVLMLHKLEKYLDLGELLENKHPARRKRERERQYLEEGDADCHDSHPFEGILCRKDCWCEENCLGLHLKSNSQALTCFQEVVKTSQATAWQEQVLLHGFDYLWKLMTERITTKQ